MTFRVPFVNPGKQYQRLKQELDAAYADVMEHGDLIDRRHLREFEEQLAGFVGTRYAVGLNSGYDALHLSLRAAGIGPGDEVIVPAHTFVATASAVVNAGATPVLVDVAGDFNIDVSKIEAALTPDELRDLGEQFWADAQEAIVIPGGDGCRVKISGMDSPETG